MSGDRPGSGIWLSTAQVAARLGKPRGHVNRLIASGRLPAIHVGGHYRVRVDALAAYMAAQEMPGE